MHITEKVKNETIIQEKKNEYPEIILIEKAIKENKIKVNRIEEKKIKLIEDFGVYGGEAESVILVKEKNYVLATDDNNVRKKVQLLEIKVIGAPRIILDLYSSKKITKEKTKESIIFLKKEGWFNQSIIDKMLEVTENV